MLKYLSAAGAVALSVTNVHAQGIEFDAATLNIETTTIAVEGFGDFSLLSYGGDVALTYGAFGVQLGVNRVTDSDMESFAFPFEVDYTGFEVHGFYDVTENLRAGVFYARDDYSGNPSDVLGVEAIWTPTIFRVEGRLASFDEEPDSGWQYNFSAQADLGEGFNPFVQVRRNNYDNGAGYYFRTEVGLSYRPLDTVEFYGSLGAGTNDFGGGIVDEETSVNLGFRLHFGNRDGSSPSSYDREPGPSSLGLDGDSDMLFRYIGFF
ncbi:hypothetical protein HKCCE4037_01490 [Rhodobacterales bacterium HKCCE4037]|nr:hypothetical protein [Rhodobacterales bacterium HKCCE4037]